MEEIMDTEGLSREEELILDIYQGGLNAISSAKELVDSRVKPMFNELLDKDRFACDIVNKLTLKEKEEVLRKVLVFKEDKESLNIIMHIFNNNYKLGWFDYNKELKKYNDTHDVKMVDIIEYIAKVIKKLPELYDLALLHYRKEIRLMEENYEMLRLHSKTYTEEDFLDE